MIERSKKMDFFESVYRFFGWWIINIEMIFLALLVSGALLLWRKRKKAGKQCIVWGCVGFCFFTIVPVGLWTIEGLENRFPKMTSLPSDAKGAIFLGGTFDKMTSEARKETAYSPAAGRFIQFIQLAKQYPHLQLVCTGMPFEAEAAKKELPSLGIDPATVLFEAESKNTQQNASMTAALIHPHPEDKWVVVTSALSMPRAVALFRKAGFNVIPYPVDYHTPGNYEPWFFIGLALNLEGWQFAMREYLGMVINYIRGRSDRIWEPIVP